ncbi:hypothetical protein KSP40_PGU009944 [Platanthera guangdongensis]|uniref:Uncharacterized protein n=1 Tax=Platanthera guangdongensis TaxID=2320717 RepID=A0ABR2M121_9ASPA
MCDFVDLTERRKVVDGRQLLRSKKVSRSMARELAQCQCKRREMMQIGRTRLVQEIDEDQCRARGICEFSYMRSRSMQIKGSCKIDGERLCDAEARVRLQLDGASSKAVQEKNVVIGRVIAKFYIAESETRARRSKSSSLGESLRRIQIVSRFADALLRKLAGVTIPSERIYGLGTGLVNLAFCSAPITYSDRLIVISLSFSPKVEVLKKLQAMPEHQGLKLQTIFVNCTNLKGEVNINLKERGATCNYANYHR